MVKPSVPALTLAAGLALAGAAFLLLHESFQPFSVSFTLDGRDRSETFRLETREPLFLEYELVLRAEGRERPPVAVTLNDRAVAVPAVASAYATARAHVPLPLDATRSGTNVLRVRVGGVESNTFVLRARVHNYYGIAPDFPRAVVVADEAVAHRRAQIGGGATAATFLVLMALSVGLVWLLGRVGRPSSQWPRAHVLATLVGPTAALLYGIGRPLHLWLSPEALVILAVVPWLLLQLTGWVIAHRGVAFAVVAPVLVTLVLLEGALRLFNAIRPTYVFYSDSYTRFRGQPGERHFDAILNSGGFNDSDHTVERPANVAYRVVALGDSFAVGVVPQRDNFLTRLESMLSARQPVEVINLGVAGTEPGDYLSILADEGLVYGPDLVLVNFFIGNDFETRSARWHERSHLVTLVRALWRLGRSSEAVRLRGGGDRDVYDDNAPGLHPDIFLEVQVDRTWVYERDSERFAAAVARAAELLDQMRDLARQAGADMLVTLIPDENQIDSALRARVVDARSLLPEQLDWGQPNRLITQALAAEQIEVLDLLPILSEAARHERVYKPADTHWNVAGNRVAAEAIAQALADRVARR